MGTTADKLSYLNTTKAKIKESINLTNINITNEPFRYYAYAIKKGIINVLNNPKEIWNNFEKVTGEGTSIELTSTENAPIEINLKGNLSQSGEPTPTDPIEINVVSGDNTITISNSDNTETQIQLISLGDIKLCKIGNYQDYIYKENNIWYLHKEIGKVVLDGSENWNDDGGTQGTDYRHNINRGRFTTSQPIGINGTYISNYFTKHTMNNDVGEFGDFYCNKNWFVFLDKSKTYDLDGWKTWLSTHNTIVYYVLATPTNTEITDSTLIYQLEKTLYSYSGQTNISQTNNDLPFILDVKALKLIE